MCWLLWECLGKGCQGPIPEVALEARAMSRRHKGAAAGIQPDCRRVGTELRHLARAKTATIKAGKKTRQGWFPAWRTTQVNTTIAKAVLRHEEGVWGPRRIEVFRREGKVLRHRGHYAAPVVYHGGDGSHLCVPSLTSAFWTAKTISSTMYLYMLYTCALFSFPRLPPLPFANLGRQEIGERGSRSTQMAGDPNSSESVHERRATLPHHCELMSSELNGYISHTPHSKPCIICSD